MAALAWVPVVVIRQFVVGGWTVCFRFFTFLFPGDDYSPSVAADVDNVAEIGVGVVEGIACLLVAQSACTTPDFSPLISYLPLFTCFLIQVYGDGNA